MLVRAARVAVAMVLATGHIALAWRLSSKVVARTTAAAATAPTATATTAALTGAFRARCGITCDFRAGHIVRRVTFNACGFVNSWRRRRCADRRRCAIAILIARPRAALRIAASVAVVVIAWWTIAVTIAIAAFLAITACAARAIAARTMTITVAITIASTVTSRFTRATITARGIVAGGKAGAFILNGRLGIAE